MEISEIQDQSSADRYWLERGPPTAVERHLAIRDTERAIIRLALADGDVTPQVVLLRRLMGEGLTDGDQSN